LLRCPFFRARTRAGRRAGTFRHGGGFSTSTDARTNEKIRAPEVRLVDEDGTQLGVVPIKDAMQIAIDKDLDLVEVAPQAAPPVCRIMDYSKFKYEATQKAKRARKHQSMVVIKEIKLRPKIETHDFETKKKHVVRFLKAGAKVKVTIMFRGREMTHTELGRALLDRLAGDVAELAKIESMPKLDGRNMIMTLQPTAPPPGHEEEKKEQADA